MVSVEDLKLQVISMGLDNFYNNIKNFINNTKVDDIANEIAEELQPKAKEKLDEAINHFYSTRPSGLKYDPTYNFAKIDINVSSDGNGEIDSTIHNNNMGAYPGYWGVQLNPDTAFDFMFENGEHGHGKYYKGSSDPTPAAYFDNNISDLQPIVDEIVQRAILSRLNLI